MGILNQPTAYRSSGLRRCYIAVLGPIAAVDNPARVLVVTRSKRRVITQREQN